MITLQPVIAFLLVFSVASCSEVKTEKITNDNVQEVIKNEGLQDKNMVNIEESDNHVRVLIESGASSIRKIKDDIESKTGLKLKFIPIQTFLDFDELDKKNFDVVIYSEGNSIEEGLGLKDTGTTVFYDSVIVAEHINAKNKLQSPIKWDDLKLKFHEKINLSSPAWDTASSTAWLSLKKTYPDVSFFDIFSIKNGRTGLNIDNLLSGKIERLAMTQSIFKMLEESYIDNKQDFNIRKIKINAPNVDIKYKLSENSKVSSKLADYFNNKNNRLMISQKLGFFHSSRNISYTANLTHEDRLLEIDAILDRAYPNVITLLAVPENNGYNQKIQELSSSLSSIVKIEKNTIETISRFREGKDKFKLYSYSDTISFHKDVSLGSDMISSVKYLENIKSNNYQLNPYKSLLEVVLEAQQQKREYPNSVVKVLFVLNSPEAKGYEYSYSAEDYKLMLSSDHLIRKIPIEIITIENGIIENANGIAALSNGISIDARESSLKRVFMITRSNF